MKRQILFAILFVLALVLVACGGQGGLEPAAQETPVAGDTPSAEESGDPAHEEGDQGIVDADDLLQALREAGLDVTVVDASEDPLFAGEAQAFEVNGAYVEVFEFDGEEAAIEAADTVTGAGTIIGTHTVDWVEPPHFYRVGRLIVLHAGSDDAFLESLAGVVGEPFLVGVAMGLPDSGE